jgi:hypothetical protein
MIESIVAVSILMTTLIIAFAIITQSYKSDNLMIKTQSILELQNEICNISLKKEYINKSTEIGAYTIHYTFENLPDSKLVCLKYEVKINEIIWKRGEQYFTQKD